MGGEHRNPPNVTTIASGAIHGRTLQLEGETCRRRTFARPQRVPPGCLLITPRVHRRSEAGPQEVGVPGPPRSRPALEPGGRERWAGVGAGSRPWRSSAAGHPGPRPGPRRGFSGEPLSGAPGPDRSVTTTVIRCPCFRPGKRTWSCELSTPGPGSASDRALVKSCRPPGFVHSSVGAQPRLRAAVGGRREATVAERTAPYR